jgi:hypothetical protein
MIGRPSTTGKLNQRDRSTLYDVNAYLTRWSIAGLALLIVIPLTALAIYCASLPAGGLMAFGAAIMISAASWGVGSLLGFLFGIPRALSSDREVSSREQHGRLIANTNLEQVSDWLTKIIVGATLVQLGPLTRRFGELAKFASGIFGSSSTQNTAMAGAVILYSVAFGFFVTYIAARSLITFIFYFSPSDWIPKQEDKQETGTGDKSQAMLPISTRSDEP